MTTRWRALGGNPAYPAAGPSGNLENLRLHEIRPELGDQHLSFTAARPSLPDQRRSGRGREGTWRSSWVRRDGVVVALEQDQELREAAADDQRCPTVEPGKKAQVDHRPLQGHP